MEDLIKWITGVSPAVVAGLFSVIMWKLNKREESSKRNHELTQDISDRINEAEKKINDIAEISSKSLLDTQINREGIKVNLRYMLQRFHAEYMMQGYVNSHQQSEFLEVFHAYEAMGGNGTGKSWAEEIETLPIRDDLPVINPFVELMKREQIYREQEVNDNKE